MMKWVEITHTQRVTHFITPQSVNQFPSIDQVSVYQINKYKYGESLL